MSTARKKKDEPAESAAEQPNAVVVERGFDEEGNLQVNVATLGDVKVTEILTILGVATNVAKRELGLES